MNKQKIQTITIAILIAILIANCSPRPQYETPETLSAIRNATILISMQVPNQARGTLLQSTGIGSLVKIQDETYLVTHNHWRQMLTDITIVSFSDADNRPIMNIIGKQFFEMIVYADAGKLVLHPPKELFANQTPVSMEAGCSLTTGQTVEVVYRQTPARETAAIQQAVVKEVLDFNGQPAYKLQSLDGKMIQQGDSGGGIWYAGMLVGVNWTSEAEVTVNSSKDVVGYTGISYAAVYSVDNP